MAEGSNYVIAILLDAKDKNLKQALESAGHQVEDFTEKAEDSGSRIQKAFVGAGIAMAFGKAIPFMKQSIGLFNQATSAASGLQSAIRASGEDWDVAYAFLKEYTQDGLVPLTQASAALKNMLAGGYGLEESMDIMRTMKDYAAYGRQGQLSMGVAIERTTQGLKAQLSNLTDNAGWTKNLKIAYDQYAASIGKSVGKLTEAEKRTAIYVAVMKDGAAVMGDAAKASGELTGKLARQEARVRTLGEAVGESLAPGYEKLLDKLGPVTDHITAFAKANPRATATLLGGSGLVAALAAMAAVLALIGGPGAILVGIVAGLVGLSTVVAAAIDRQRRYKEETWAAARATKEEAEKVRGLQTELAELLAKTDLTNDELERLDEVQKALKISVPAVTEAMKDQNSVITDMAGMVSTYAGAVERRLEATINMLKLQRKIMLRELAILNERIDAFGSGSNMSFEAQADLRALKLEAIGAATELGVLQDLINELQGTPSIEPEDGGDGGADGGGRTRAEIEAEIAGIEDLIAAYGLLIDFKAEGLGIPPSLLFSPETFEEAVQQYIDLMGWIEELRNDADERDAERDAKALERKQAALEAYYRSAKGKLDRLTKGWDDLSDVGVRMARATSDALGAALGTILSGTADTAEKLQQIWGSFINWLWMELGRIIARLIMAAILKSFLGGGALNYSEVALETVTQASAQGGGKILRPTRGYDYVPTLLDGGETVLSVDLTRRVERLVNDWEAWSSPTPAVATAEGYETGGPSVIEEHYHFHSADFSSFDRALRGGQLGQALRRSMQHGRLGR